MCCTGCKKNSKIVNKYFNLCLNCNTDRLRKKKNICSTIKPKVYKKSFKRKKNTFKTKIDNYTFVKNLDLRKTKKNKGELSMIEKDEIFYEKCFNLSNHKCEECGKDLPEDFRDDNGKVLARFRYSHIIPKSIESKLRHKVININHLCLLHHNQWENGDKKSMNIYKKNKKRLPNYF